MLEHFVAVALKRRVLVLVVFAATMGIGVWSLLRLPVDAFPDTSSIQVQVNTSASAMNGEEIEHQITLPVELAISGLPGLKEVRSISKFGISQVTATFTDETDIYDARQFILERLGTVELPEGISPPQLGPISSGLGEVFCYTLSSPDGSHSLEELRTLQDWVIAPELRKTPGVAEVTAWGGNERQFQVAIDPQKLIAFNMDLGEVLAALEENNRNAGGGQIVQGGESVLVHGRGRVTSIVDIENIVIRASGGTPTLVRDVAEVMIGHELRRGAVTAEGTGEVVLGLGYMLLGENSRIVARALRDRLETAAKSLPDGVQATVVYDRTELVNHVLSTVKHNLMAGAALVIVVLFIMFGSLRAGLLVAMTIPMAMLFAAIGMYEFAIAASLLSLGAIDFGLFVDGSVVITDVNQRALAAKTSALGRALTAGERLEAILESSKEVVKPIVFGLGIILIVFIPILMLEGTEGKMFRPMALTFIFALLGSLVIALFLSPVLSYYLLPNPKGESRSKSGEIVDGLYAWSLRVALRYRGIVIAGSIGALAITGFIARGLGSEFVPRLNEGAIVMNLIRLPGIALEESVAYNTRMEQLLKEQFPDEISHIWSRTGTAEVATDPMGIELTDLFITLTPRETWTTPRTYPELSAAIQEMIADLPGQSAALSQPIEMRMNELSSGLRSDVGIKVSGDSFEELQRVAEEINTILLSVEGATDVSVDQVSGLPTLQVDVNRDVLARLGVSADEVMDFVELMGNKHVGDVFEGQRRFPLAARLPEALIHDAEQLNQMLVRTSNGALLPLGELASIREVDGLANINREWGRRLVRVQANVHDRDVMSFVNEARERIEAEVTLPEGYMIEWSGQFEHLVRSQQRFAIVIPLTLLAVFVVLYMGLNNMKDVLIIYTGIPFAIIGGVIGLYARDLPFSVSAIIGFLALTGIAVLDGQVMVAAIRGFRESGLGLAEAAMQGARRRLWPVLATSITDALGFMPMAVSTEIGAEVQRPLATVVVAGIITSTVLTLIVLPVLYVMTSKESAHGEDEQPI